MEDKFLMFVAEIMGCDVQELSMETKYLEFDKWDSVMHLNLVMELEEEYDVSIPIENASKVQTLRDLYSMVTKEA